MIWKQHRQCFFPKDTYMLASCAIKKFDRLKMHRNYSGNSETSEMDKGEVINLVKAYRLLLYDYFHPEKVYLFGSYARNTYREDSDIDVAIVVNNLEGEYFTIHPLLWKLRRQIENRIEPVLIEKDFDDAGFLAEIERDGIEID